MGKELTFWDHFDSLRKVIFRIVLALFALAVVAFLCKDTLFEIVLAPHRSSFVTYKFFNHLSTLLGLSGGGMDDFKVELISTQLTSQLLIHMSVAFYAALMLASPYIIYQLFVFVAPALHEHERRSTLLVMASTFICFFVGVLLSYYLIFPFSFRFLATYQVSPEVKTLVTLSSYIDTFMMLMLLMGFMFELPTIAWFLARVGILNDRFMRTHRKHALVIILAVVAIITPTTDAFTMLFATAPIWLLYEASIQVVRRVVRARAAH